MKKPPRWSPAHHRVAQWALARYLIYPVLGLGSCSSFTPKQAGEGTGTTRAVAQWALNKLVAAGLLERHHGAWYKLPEHLR